MSNDIQGLKEEFREHQEAKRGREARAVAGILHDAYLDGDDEQEASEWQKFAETGRVKGNMWPKVDEFSPMESLPLTEDQLHQLAIATRDRNGILIGSPGTGKTTTVVRMILELEKRYGRKRVAVCSPTGKAAARLGEIIKRCGGESVPTTIHSLLGCDSSFANFRFNKERKLKVGFVVIDESSMLSTPLLAAVACAIERWVHLLLVGDLGQLLPIDHGAPLRDLVQSGKVSTGRLTEIHRNGGKIAQVCLGLVSPGDKRVLLNGITNYESIEIRKPPLPVSMDSNIQITGTEATVEEVVKIFFDLIEKRSAAIHDVQLIVACNDKGDVSRNKVNQTIQKKLQGQRKTPPVPKSKLQVGDKIICLRNGRYRLASSEDAPPSQSHVGLRPLRSQIPTTRLVNGEQGFVESIFYQDVHERDLLEGGDSVANALIGNDDNDEGEEDFTPDELPNPLTRKVSSSDEVLTILVARAKFGETVVEFDLEYSEESNRFDLAYAITAHKSQGSEWPYVLVALDPSFSARRATSREWFYTAISRAKQECILIGQVDTAVKMAINTKLNQRKTLLKEKLK